MITVTARMKELMEQVPMEPFYMVEIGTVYRTTSFYSDITLSDSRVFASDGKLVYLDPPRLSTSVDREQYKIQLADPEFMLGAYADQGLTGMSVEVRAGFVDKLTNLPETNIENTLLIYGGTIDGTSYNTDVRIIGENLLSITCSSPMADLDMKKRIFLSKDFIRNRNPDDACCDQIYEGSGAIRLKWGRA